VDMLPALGTVLIQQTYEILLTANVTMHNFVVVRALVAEIK